MTKMEDKKYKKWLDDCSNRHHPDFDGRERFSLTYNQIREIIDEELLSANERLKILTSKHTHRGNCSCVDTAIALTACDKDEEWNKKIKTAFELLDINCLNVGTNSKTGEELVLAVVEARKILKLLFKENEK